MAIHTKLNQLNNNLSGMIHENWGENLDPPSQIAGAHNETPMPTHPRVLDQLHSLVEQIDSKVQFLAERL